MGAAAIIAGVSVGASIIGGIEQNNQAKKAEKEQKALSAQQAASAEQLQVETLQQPKQIASDNFMANKSSQLAKLRLGMNSTITGASTVSPSMVPSTNTDAKTKLGL